MLFVSTFAYYYESASQEAGAGMSPAGVSSLASILDVVKGLSECQCDDLHAQNVAMGSAFHWSSVTSLIEHFTRISLHELGVQVPENRVCVHSRLFRVMHT
jgi:hypothetical protein